MGIIVTAEFKPNAAFFADLEKAIPIAIEQAGEAVRGDLIISQTMPFDKGTLQNENTFLAPVIDSKTRLITMGPQARRLYYNPDYNFQRGKNPNAGARWLDPYLAGGEKEGKFREYFAKFMKKELGV
ncbi:MAG TPA: hypothetical protein VIK21_08590 [Desulfuromonadaceae bacterium]